MTVKSRSTYNNRTIVEGEVSVTGSASVSVFSEDNKSVGVAPKNFHDNYNSLLTKDVDALSVLQSILYELKKANFYLSFLSEDEEDIELEEYDERGL